MIAAIDADVWAYRFYYSNSEKIDWGGGDISVVDDFKQAKEDIKYFLDALMERTKCTDYLMVLSTMGKPNFRYNVLPTYKGNRPSEKPNLVTRLKEHLASEYKSKWKHQLEGDDVLGILATLHPWQYLVCTIDKDLKQIPGKHFNWDTDELFEVDAISADRWFYQQIIQGDSGDGYYGIPGIGPKKSEKYLDKIYQSYQKDKPDVSLEKYVWKSIISLYEKNSLTEEYAFQQARVARILRATDFDYDKQEPILWKPK